MQEFAHVESAAVIFQDQIDPAVSLPRFEPHFRSAGVAQHVAGIVQANLRKSKIVNADTEGRADVASIAADYPSYAVGRSAPMLQCIFKLLKFGIGKDETSVGLFFAREWLEILDFDAGGVRVHGPQQQTADLDPLRPSRFESSPHLAVQALNDVAVQLDDGFCDRRFWGSGHNNAPKVESHLIIMATVRVGTPLYFLSCATPLSDAELVPVLPKTASGSPSDFQIIVVVLFNEGSLVRITGFLATGPLKPHANTGESVNRRIKKPANNDFHISLVETAQGTEFEGVVVEMIPQDRPAGWTLAKLGKVQQQRQRVLVTGALFYDNEHFINPDPNNDMNGQPRRFALWEVHPITKFQVCGNASGNCDPNTASDWTELESLH